MLTVIFYICLFIYGIVIGSFLNVCILRVPLKETIVSKRSHCMTCGHQLAWYDLFPLFSYLFLRGKCRYCKAHISAQYPIVEGLNGLLAVATFMIGGFWPHLIEGVNDWVLIARLPDGSNAEIFDWVAPWINNGILLLDCLVISALIVVAVVDWRTFEIPFGCDVFIGVMGGIRIVLTIIEEIYYRGKFNEMDLPEGTEFTMNHMWLDYVIGFAAMYGLFYLIIVLSKAITKQEGMGGGDLKLMAAAGLFLGWKYIIVSLIFGCLYGVVIHYARIIFLKKEHVLAFGPYLAAGIVTAIWFGEDIINWYVGMMF